MRAYARTHARTHTRTHRDYTWKEHYRPGVLPSDKVLQEDLTKHMEQEWNCCITKTHLPVLKSYMIMSRTVTLELAPCHCFLFPYSETIHCWSLHSLYWPGLPPCQHLLFPRQKKLHAGHRNVRTGLALFHPISSSSMLRLANSARLPMLVSWLLIGTPSSV